MNNIRFVQGLHRGVLAVSLLVGLALGWCSQAASAATQTTLSVFAAASLSDAFDDLGKMFEAAHSGVKVEFNFAGSQQLATQIEHGAGADLFASADERWMSYLKKRDQLQGEGTQFVQNRLVVIVPRSNPARIDRLQDLGKSGVKLVLGAATVPVGAYSREVIRRLARARGFAPDYGRRVLGNLASEEDNVKQVVAKVQLGEADAGFVYRSDITPPVARQVRVFDIPDSCSVLAHYPVAVLKDAPNPELAAEFLKLLLSPEGQAVLAKNGFLPILPDH